ncbi:MAG: DinB family protein [Bellilinea sp.]|jgi:hypothetical protein
MRILVGLENNNERRSLAWALEHPGCFAYGAESSSAVINISKAFVEYKRWLGGQLSDSWLADAQDVDIRLIDVWDVYEIDEHYDVIPDGKYAINAWFRYDWKPLTRLEVQRGLRILACLRADLLQLVSRMPAAVLDREYPGERWNVHGVLGHIATAEWWYLDRLGLGQITRRELPEDVFERLAWSRQRLEDALPALEGVVQVVGKQGEIWSPRKLLRRAAWHERDHIEHIRKLLSGTRELG